MRVHPVGRSEHRSLRGDADLAQSIQPRPDRTRGHQLREEGRKRVGTEVEELCIHITMRARIDVADQPGFGMRVHLQAQTFSRERADVLGGGNTYRKALDTGVRSGRWAVRDRARIGGLNGYDTLPDINARRDITATSSSRFTSTSAAPNCSSRQ